MCFCVRCWSWVTGTITYHKLHLLEEKRILGFYKCSMRKGEARNFNNFTLATDESEDTFYIIVHWYFL